MRGAAKQRNSATVTMTNRQNLGILGIEHFQGLTQATKFSAREDYALHVLQLNH